jgi:predicted DCC family thiol-disulfide oxidoreductase YuxK
VWVPAQAEGVHAAARLTPADTDSAAWAITSAGRTLRGERAVCAGLDELLPFGLPICGSVVRLPAVSQVAAAVYAWVARNRHRFPGVAACSLRTPKPLAESIRAELRRRFASAHG